MLALISPAKTLDFNLIELRKYSIPAMLDNSNKLIKILQQKSINDIAKLMKISAKLAKLNYQRFQDFNPSFDLNNAKQAIFAFRGDVYTGINVDSFNSDDISFLNQNVKILSGLYGILKPLDLIQAYRLEMGTNLHLTKAKNLYEFWDDKISQNLNKNESQTIINLASNEYFKVVNKNKLTAQIIDIIFKENKNGVYKIIGIHAKKARGLMINFMVKNKINKAINLQNFKMANYHFNQELSNKNSWVFTR